MGIELEDIQEKCPYCGKPLNPLSRTCVPDDGFSIEWICLWCYKSLKPGVLYKQFSDMQELYQYIIDSHAQDSAYIKLLEDLDKGCV